RPAGLRGNPRRSGRRPSLTRFARGSLEADHAAGQGSLEADHRIRGWGTAQIRLISRPADARLRWAAARWRLAVARRGSAPAWHGGGCRGWTRRLRRIAPR